MLRTLRNVSLGKVSGLWKAASASTERLRMWVIFSSFMVESQNCVQVTNYRAKFLSSKAAIVARNRTEDVVKAALKWKLERRGIGANSALVGNFGELK